MSSYFQGSAWPCFIILPDRQLRHAYVSSIDYRRAAPPHVHEIERFQSTPFFHEKIRFITTDDRLPEIEEDKT